MIKTPPLDALQAAIFQCLTAAMPTAKIYDVVPQDTLFPYLTLGAPTLKDQSTVNYQVWNCTRTLHAWSRQSGQGEANALLTAMCSALTGPTLVVAGWNVIQVWPEMLDVSDDPDLKSRHGVLRVRFLLQQEEM